MREVRHIAKRALIPALVHGRVEALPVSWELSALRFEHCPALLPGERIDFALVSAGVVIDDHIRDQTQPGAVRRFDEVQQLLLGSEPGRNGTLLVELAQIIVIVRVIAHRRPTLGGGLMDRREP